MSTVHVSHTYLLFLFSLYLTAIVFHPNFYTSLQFLSMCCFHNKQLLITRIFYTTTNHVRNIKDSFSLLSFACCCYCLVSSFPNIYKFNMIWKLFCVKSSVEKIFNKKKWIWKWCNNKYWKICNK